MRIWVCAFVGLVAVLSSLMDFARCQPVEKRTDDWLAVLELDPRLKVPVSFHFKKRPTEDEFFGIIKKVSGVRLQVAPQEIEGKVTFNNISATNTPVWRIMKLVARNQLVDGYWEKSGDGYILHGKPKKEFGMAVLTPEAEKAEVEKLRAFEEAKAQAAKATEDFKKWHPLGMDMRLRAKFTVNEKDPKLSDILERLRSSTGLSFAIADNLTYHEPKMGLIVMPDAAAYRFMEIIARIDLDDGRWEKTDNGYRLEGTSRALRPPPGTSRKAPWGWIAGGSVAMALAVTGIVVYRRRVRRVATNQTTG